MHELSPTMSKKSDILPIYSRRRKRQIRRKAPQSAATKTKKKVRFVNISRACKSTFFRGTHTYTIEDGFLIARFRYLLPLHMN